MAVVTEEKKRCIHCGSLQTVKRGVRKLKNCDLQIFFCKNCRKRFSCSPLPGHTYPASAIMQSVIYFNLGYTYSKIRALLQSRFNCAPSIAVIHQWLGKFGRFSAQKAYRAERIKNMPPHRVIKKKLFRHRQNYLYQVHQPKLAEIEDRFPPLFQYLSGIFETNDALNDTDFPLRPSMLAARIPIAIKFQKSSRSYSSRMAGLALTAARSNDQRHALLQRFFLATDKSTVATEVPVFLNNREAAKIVHLSGGILGHIDFLQVFEKNITILDYNPASAKDKKAPVQVLLYAVALSVRTGIHLKYVKCAWFDEKDYFIFSALPAYFLLKKYAIKKETDTAGGLI
jgi:hypothetical protein